MTFFEHLYLALEPFVLPLQQQVRSRLRELLKPLDVRPRVLDTGGRKSHYTIALPADIYIADLPRQSSIQMQLHLGIDRGVASSLMRRRSNVRGLVLDNMTVSSFRSHVFDFVVAVEVLEHVDQDGQFVSEVYRVLKPGGAFLMTTPNGDFRENTNPDHKRHYRKRELDELLARYFDHVQTKYAIKGGRFHCWGLASWSVARPIRTLRGMLGNLVNRLESSDKVLADSPIGTHHLITVACKSATQKSSFAASAVRREQVVAAGEPAGR